MGDIYIHAGDFTKTGTFLEIAKFEQFVASLPHPIKIVIAGNHDMTFDVKFYEKYGKHRFHVNCPEDPQVCREVLAKSNNLIYLEDELVNVLGINIYGR